MTTADNTLADKYTDGIVNFTISPRNQLPRL